MISSNGIERPISVNSTSSTCILPSVSVPVLSRHKVSTCANVSRANSSCTNTFFLESAMIPTARLMLMSSTRPFGSIPRSPAAVDTTAWLIGSPRK